MIENVKKLKRHILPDFAGLTEIIDCGEDALWEELFSAARETCLDVYGDEVYLRGLIEFSSFCKNDCYYCGLRRSNAEAERFRLTGEEILACCENGYGLGFRTFVLQGGEDPFFDETALCGIIGAIKNSFPDCAVTLSVGEKSVKTYRAFFEAGADRYLLRHETSDCGHYALLHPREMSFENRINCLYVLKQIGFQTGCGFMVGSPFQTTANLAGELYFLKEFRPHMVGIGPFLTHRNTPFRDKENGSAELTLKMLALIRLICPETLLPATTALGTASLDGRERGILAGANVVMPNLSPIFARQKYNLYDDKLNTGAESAEGFDLLRNKIASVGRRIAMCRGDSKVKNS